MSTVSEKKVSRLRDQDIIVKDGVDKYQCLETVRKYGDGSFRIQVHDLEKNEILYLEWDEREGNPVLAVRENLVAPSETGRARVSKARAPVTRHASAEYLDVVFENVPGVGMVFDHVETPDGRRVKAGKWVPSDSAPRLRIRQESFQ